MKATVTKSVTEYTLTMTEEEASVLKEVCAYIGGHPETTKRCVTDAISQALKEVGVPSGYYRLDGELHFVEKN